IFCFYVLKKLLFGVVISQKSFMQSQEHYQFSMSRCIMAYGGINGKSKFSKNHWTILPPFKSPPVIDIFLLVLTSTIHQKSLVRSHFLFEIVHGPKDHACSLLVWLCIQGGPKI